MTDPDRFDDALKAAMVSFTFGAGVAWGLLSAHVFHWPSLWVLAGAVAAFGWYVYRLWRLW